RSEIVAHGYDPMIGFLHSYDKDRAALVFDLMEPLRPVVDRTVLDLALNRKFESADFTIRKDGVCRLNPELARHIVQSFELRLSNAKQPLSFVSAGRTLLSAELAFSGYS
ncbi:MAG: CRISPR-associated endonuclease Cas1, partial [Nitrobacter sp.]